ncbi:MAG: nuclear transport factor 2 family protein [Bryobacteraceae bacterium]
MADISMPAVDFAARAKEYARALDSFDADDISSYYAKNAVVRVAGAMPVIGRDAIRQSLARFLATLEGARHTHNHSVVTLPVTYVNHWRDRQIEAVEVRFYLEARLAGAISSFERNDPALAA